MPGFRHVQEAELAGDVASLGHTVHVRFAPKPRLLKVLAMHEHVREPAVEDEPDGHAAHCKPAPVAALVAKKPAAQPHDAAPTTRDTELAGQGVQ